MRQLLSLIVRHRLVIAFAAGFLALAGRSAAQPIISGPGYSAITIDLGDSATFSGLTATGVAPLQYQWVLVGTGGAMTSLSDGTDTNGTLLSGTHTNTLVMTGTAAADAGNYALQVTDGGGSSRTSTVIALIVKPAAAPVITVQPLNYTITAGNPVTFSVLATGSYPRTYHWYKGTPPDTSTPVGTNASSLALSAVAAPNAGSYYVTITNATGTTTSAAGVLTVSPATPITFSSISSAVSIVAGQSFSIVATPAGSSPITEQWQKDGAPITGATNGTYSVGVAATTDAGSYTLVATNGAGSVTSGAISVAVSPATVPVIATQPSSLTVSQGMSASFSVAVANASPLTYQWQKNGAPILNATGSSFSISSALTSDAASYTVAVANVAGSVTSQPAVLTVTPPVPAVLGSVTSSVSTTIGSSLTLQGPSILVGVAPFTYQWYKDGAAISGATSANYTVASAQLTDAGKYFEAVTNAGGTTNSGFIQVTVNPPANSGTPWIDAAQQGTVIYFLFAQHLERYDLINAVWMPSIALTQTATAFIVASDGVYVAFGRSVSQFPLNLSSSLTLANLPGTATALCSLGQSIYAVYGPQLGGANSLVAINRSTGSVSTALTTADLLTTSTLVALPSGQTLFTPNGVWGPQTYSAPFGGGIVENPFNYNGTFASATRGYVFPDQVRMADNGGTVYNVSDGRVNAAFGGSFTDLTFLSDGTPVVLRGGKLTEYAGPGLGETGHASLAVAGSRIFGSGQNVLVFYPGTGTGNSSVGMTSFAASNFLTSYPAAPAVNASALTFTPDAVLQDNAGTVYLYSAINENIFRWSPSTSAYLTPIRLIGAPKQVVYSATLNRLYCSYSSGQVTQIDAGASLPAEQPFAAFADTTLTVTAADNFLFAVLQDAQDSGHTEAVLDVNGRTTAFAGSGAYASAYTWSSPNQLLFGSDGSLQPLSASGTLVAPANHFAGATPSTGIIPSSDGTHLLSTAGQVFDNTLRYLGILGNSVTDAVWIGGVPYTLHSGSAGSEVQSWSATNYFLTAAAELPGTPLRLLPLGSSQLLLISLSGAVPIFTVLNGDLQVTGTTLAASSTAAAPSFLSQPSSSIAASAGSALDLAVSTSGTQPQTFQWYENSVPVVGATASVLHFAAVATTDAGSYTLVATNTQGSATSVTTTLSVYPALSFATQPQSLAVSANDTATLVATIANGATGSFQWYFNGQAISGATSGTLVISPVNQLTVGSYTVAISNPASTVYSNAAALTIGQSSAPAFTAVVPDQLVVAGSNVLFAAGAFGSGTLTYQWYFDGVALSGATGSSLAIPNAQTANAGQYTVSVTNAAGSVTSNAATLQVGSTPPPIVTVQPQSQSAIAGTTVVFTAGVINASSDQWFLNGVALFNATNASLTLTGVTAASAGNYTLVATGDGGAVTSTAAALTVTIPSYAGMYLGTFGGSGGWALAVDATGHGQFLGFLPSSSAAINAQIAVDPTGAFLATGFTAWADPATGSRRGARADAISGVSGQISGNLITGQVGGEILALTGALDPSVQAGVVPGIYQATQTGGTGTTFAAVGPDGSTFVLVVGLPGTGQSNDFITGTLNGQGLLSRTSNAGNQIAVTIGATNQTLADTVTPAGSSLPVVFGSLANVATTARLVNLSVRANLTAASATLTTGFAVSGTGSKAMLLRGIGPALAGFGISTALARPQLSLFDGSSHLIWTGTSWGGAGTLAAVFAQVGAFPLAANSADCAIELSESPGTYTTQIVGLGNPTGVVLAEVYDADSAGATARLANLSALAAVGSGADTLAAGFVVQGTGPEMLLLRGDGPSLAYFSVPTPLAAPQLTLFDSNGNAIATNTGWNNDATLSAAFVKVGAFPFLSGSADTALLVTLNPGLYTVQVSGQGGSTGTGLVEVYELK